MLRDAKTLEIPWLLGALLLPLAGPLQADLANYRSQVRATPDLVDYFTLDGHFEDEFDGSNGPNHGLATNDALFSDDALGGSGNSAAFNGLDTFTILPSIQDSWTILIWVKTDTPQIGSNESQFYQGSGLVYADVPGGANDWGTAVTGSKFAFGLGNPDTTIHSKTDVTTGEWFYLAAVRQVDLDAGNAQYRVYVNGVLEESGVHANTQPLNAAPSITIGGNTIDTRLFVGSVDEVALFEGALEDDVIASFYNAFTGLQPCFKAEPPNGTAPLNVSFDASCSQSADSPINTYSWDFGDGAFTTGAKVAHEYGAPGRYTVTLTVSTISGISSSTSTVIRASFASGDVSPWISSDIGSPRLPGGARREGDCISVFGSGTGLNAMVDEVHFVHQEAAGDTKLTTQVKEAILPAAARAGLMMRDTLDPDSALAMVTVQGTNAGSQAVVLSRTSKGGRVVAKTVPGNFAPPNAFLRLERKGADVLTSISTDGTTWMELQTITLTAPAEKMRAGMVVTPSDRFLRDLTALALFCGTRFGDGSPPGKAFHRGDADDNGLLQLTDAVRILTFLFLGGEAPTCAEAADADDNGTLQLTDAVRILGFLFLGQPPPATPGPPPEACGPDPQGSPDVGCELYTKC